MSGDTISANLGDEAQNAQVGVGNTQTTTTTTTHTEPVFQANPQIILPPNLPPTNDTIILYLVKQAENLANVSNGLGNLHAKVDTLAKTNEDRATSVEKKLDDQNQAWETKFKSAKDTNDGIQASVDRLTSGFKVMQDTNADLDHKTAVSLKQSEDNGQKLTKMSTSLDAVIAKIDKTTHVVDPRAVAYALLIIGLIGISFFVGFGFYVIRGGFK